MKNGLRELRRRPQRFVAVTGALALLAVLLLFLGGLLDGLYLGATGALRAQRGDVLVYSADANDSVIRSRVTPEVRQTVEQVEGVDATGGLGLSLLGAEVPGEADLADAAVIGYERHPEGVPDPPPEGEAWADRRLEAFGVKVGDELALGPARSALRVRGWVDDTNYLLQGALWVAPATWREIQNANRPDAPFPPGVWQVLVIDGAGDAASLASRIDAATAGATNTLTKQDAVLASPGTRQQRSTFNGIIVVAFLVVGLVAALFFALLTLERAAIYGVLKALGTPTRSLVLGLLTQAVTLAVLAFVIGGLATAALTFILPARIPLQLESSRAMTTLIGLVVAAAVGGTISLRRIARIDPVAAIGTGT